VSPRAGLHRAERMLDRLSTLAHGLWVCIKAPLHSLEQILVLPSRNPPLWPGRTLRFERTILTGCGPVTPQHLAVFFVCIAIRQSLPRWTAVGWQIRKVLLIEAPLRFGARRLRLGQSYRDAGLVAREDLRAAEVAAIGNGLKSVLGPGCVKTCASRECAELFSPFPPSTATASAVLFPFNVIETKISTRKFAVGVFTQPGSKPEKLDASICFPLCC
jgi:hypothetical protein